MRVKIDNEKCIGCGLCEEILPEVFTVGMFRARVLRPQLRPAEEEAALSAALNCPARAISFLDDDEELGEGPAGNHDEKGHGEK